MDLAARHLAPLASLLGRPLDIIYSRLGGINGNFFHRGWGDLGCVDLKADLEVISQWPPPAPLKAEWRLLERGSWRGVPFRHYEATFTTPCVRRVYDALPPESRVGRAQLIVPDGGGGPRAGVVHLAATGDHGWRRRLWLGLPMVGERVATLALESPFYGARKPADQRGSKLRKVSDLLTLGWATIIESLHLLHWLGEEGCEHKGITGLSMGGVHACMAAGLYPQTDLAAVPVLAPRSAAVAYCDGALRPLMALDALADGGAGVRAVVAAAAAAVSHLREASHALAALEEVRAAQRRSLGAAAGEGEEEAAAGVVDGSAAAAATPSSNPDLNSTQQQQQQHYQQQHHHQSPTSSSSNSNAASSAATSAAASAAAASDAVQAALLGALRLRGAQGKGTGGAREADDALRHLRMVLETYTDVVRYPPPRRPDASIIVGAESDAYVSADSVRALHAHWPGSELRLVSGGHVSAFLLHQNTFRTAIRDAMQRL